MSDPLPIAPDFIALASSGAPLKTRDRRAVALIAVDAAAGIIRGSVGMEGELSWRRDGGFTGAPPGLTGGVAGPLDLVPPQAAGTEPQRASPQDALNDGEAKDRVPFCCD